MSIFLFYIVYSRFNFLVIICRLTKYMMIATMTVKPSDRFMDGDMIPKGDTSMS